MCEKCPDKAINSIRLTGVGILVILVIVFIVRSTMKSAIKPLELHSVYLRIFTDYIQLVAFIGMFNLNWPKLVRELLAT